MSGNVIDNFNDKDKKEQLDVPKISPAVGSSTQALPQLPTPPSNTATYDNVMSQLENSNSLADYSQTLGNVNTQDLLQLPGQQMDIAQTQAPVGDATTQTQVAADYQRQFNEGLQQQTANVSQVLTDTDRMNNFFPTLFNGITADDLEERIARQHNQYQSLMQSAPAPTDVTKLTPLPQTRTDPNQFRPDSTQNPFQRFWGWLGDEFRKGTTPTEFDLSKDKFGVYGQGSIGGALYALNLPFQAFWGGLADLNNAVKGITSTPLGRDVGNAIKGATSIIPGAGVLFNSPITEIDKFVNRNVPGYKPITLFNDTPNFKGSHFIDAVRGQKVLSFSDYRDNGNPIGIRTQQNINPLKWYQDPSFAAGFLLDIVADPTDLLTGAVSKFSKRVGNAKKEADALEMLSRPKAPNPKLPNVGEALKAGTEAGLSEVQKLRKQITRSPVGITPNGTFVSGLKDLPSAVGLTQRADGTFISRPTHPLERIATGGVNVPPVTDRLKPVDKRRIFDLASTYGTTTQPTKLPIGTWGQTSKKAATTVSDTLPKRTIPSRVFTGEYTLAEFADIISKPVPGMVVSADALKKNRRSLADLTELAKYVPAPNGKPIVSPSATRPFRTWKQFRERISALPDPAYQRIFAEYGAPIDTDALKSGTFNIRLPDGTEIAPKEPPMKVWTDPSVIDPRYRLPGQEPPKALPGESSRPMLPEGSTSPRKPPVPPDGTVAPETSLRRSQAERKIAEAQLGTAGDTTITPMREVYPETTIIKKGRENLFQAARRERLEALEEMKVNPTEKVAAKFDRASAVLAKPEIVTPDVLKAVFDETLTKRQKAAPDVVQTYLDALANLSDVSDSVKLSSLDLRQSTEVIQNATKELVDNSPDIGRQVPDFTPKVDSRAEMKRRYLEAAANAPRPAADIKPEPIAANRTVRETPPPDKTSVVAYQGTRVQNLDYRTADPTVGGTRGEFGTAHYFTSDPLSAEQYAKASLARDLPVVEGREFGQATVNQVTVDETKLLRNENVTKDVSQTFIKQAQQLLDPSDPFDRQIMKAYKKEVKDAKTYQDLYAGFDRAVTKVNGAPAVSLSERFQREINAALRDMGYDGYRYKAPTGSVEYAIFGDNAIKDAPTSRLVDADTLDALEGAVARFNAESLNASKFPGDEAAQVRAREAALELTAQINDHLYQAVEQSAEEQSKALARVLEAEQLLEQHGTDRYIKYKNRVESAVSDSIDSFDRNIPTDPNPCRF